MNRLIGASVLGLVCLVAEAPPSIAAVEATSDILFETMAKVESRFRSYRATSADTTEQLKRAEAAEVNARGRAKTARLSGNQRAFEEAQAEATDALVTQILLQERRVVAALEAFEANRRDLTRVLPRLRSKAAGAGSPDGDREQGQRLVTMFRDLGHDVRNLALFFQELAGANADAHTHMKVASTTASLLAIQQALEIGRRSAEAGPGGFGQAALAVANALETINGTLPLLLLRRDFLLDQKEKLRVANAIAMNRLASASVFGAKSLDPAEITNMARDEINRDMERDRRVDELFEGEGVGPSAPSRGENRHALESLKF
jgi:hypothetical protein